MNRVEAEEVRATLAKGCGFTVPSILHRLHYLYRAGQRLRLPFDNISPAKCSV